MFRMMSATNAKPIECLGQPMVAYKELKQRLEPPKDPKKRKKFLTS
jgi:hypothetical protein